MKGFEFPNGPQSYALNAPKTSPNLRNEFVLARTVIGKLVSEFEARARPVRQGICYETTTYVRPKS